MAVIQIILHIIVIYKNARNNDNDNYDDDDMT